MTDTSSDEPTTNPDDFQIMLQLGVSPTYLRILLGEETHPLGSSAVSESTKLRSTLSPTEVEVLRAGGASGLEDPSSGSEADEHAILKDLIRECETLANQCHSLTEVAAILRTSIDEAETLVHHVPPRLYAFRLGAASWAFPWWQFIGSNTIPGLTLLLSVTGAAIKPLTFSRFMLTENGDLIRGARSLCPRDWLIGGLDPEPVLRLVQNLEIDLS